MSFITDSHLMPRICPASAGWEEISERCEGRDLDSCDIGGPFRDDSLGSFMKVSTVRSWGEVEAWADSGKGAFGACTEASPWTFWHQFAIWRDP